MSDTQNRLDVSGSHATGAAEGGLDVKSTRLFCAVADLVGRTASFRRMRLAGGME